MHIARGIVYNSGSVLRALKGSMDTGFGISYSEARDLEILTEAKYFEHLGNSREAIISSGSARFNERVKEIQVGNSGGMKGGMAD